MVRISRSWLFGFSLLATLTLSGQPLTWALKSRLLAQAPSTFTLPESVPDGTTIRIDGSSSMEVINQSLEAQFEDRYDGTTVELSANGSDEALQSLLEGDIELAAIGRPLTTDEKAQGLREALISREKIAIVVAPTSSFDENLTFQQFAQIFRGEITDWSELGGEPGEIRFVDRPESSDTRAAFQNYPVFQEAPFETGATADPVDEDDTRAVIEALGDDGVGYAIASQVLDNDSVKIVPMHQTLPDDPRYPFSQPRGYVYLEDPSPAVQAFLGFATSPDGQAAVAEAKAAEAAEAADLDGAAPAGDLSAISPDGQITARVTELGQVILEDPNGVEVAALAGITSTVTALEFSPDSQALAIATDDSQVQVWSTDGRPLGEPFEVAASPPLNLTFTNDNRGLAVAGAEGTQLFDFQGNPLSRKIPFWWFLLPLALLGLLLWALTRGRKATPESSSDLAPAVAPPEPDQASADLPEVATVTPPDLGPDPAMLDGAEPQLSSRAHTVINEDREQSFAFTDPVADAGLAAGPTAGAMALDPLLSQTTSDRPTPDAPSLEEPPETGTLPQVEADRDIPTPSIPTPDMATPDIATPMAVEPAIRDPWLEEPVVEEPSQLDLGAAAIAGGTLLGATAAANQWNPDRRPVPEAPSDEQSEVEAAKYDAGAEALDMETLATVDEGLDDLPDGYGESRIVLMPRDPQWAYTYWDVSNDHRTAVRQQGGQQLALRLYDVTDIDLEHQAPHSLQQYDCDEMARTWYVPIPVSDRDYVIEIGYLSTDDRWLVLARSASAHIPPVYPSDWFDDRFLTIDWNEDLHGKTFATLKRPVVAAKVGDSLIHDAIFDQAQGTESLRVAGSVFGSVHQVPEQAISSFVFPSGMGRWALPTVSGMSGVGFSASAPPMRPRKFWLVADAELIVYGATEPDATVSVGSRVVELNPDGTFRFHMSFQDGMIDYPIQAVAADGEQTRSVHMEFERETSNRNTNTQEDATEEWFDEWF